MKHKESDTQIACVRWFRLQYPKLAKLLISVPNGGRRDIVTGKILKAEGAIAGVSDLILLLQRGDFGCLCIEMKTDKGTQSDSQKAWQKETEKFGNKYVICRSIDDFMKEINLYLFNSKKVE